jgi:hypothetical protein
MGGTGEGKAEREVFYGSWRLFTGKRLSAAALPFKKRDKKDAGGGSGGVEAGKASWDSSKLSIRISGGLADWQYPGPAGGHGLRLIRFMTVKRGRRGSGVGGAGSDARHGRMRGKTEGRKLLITRVINLFLAEIRVRNNRKHDEVMCYRILNHLLIVYKIYLMRHSGFLRK